MTALRQVVSLNPSVTGLAPVCELNGSPAKPATAWGALLLLFCCSVGTGGIARLGGPPAPSSSGGTWLGVRHSASRHAPAPATGRRAIGVADRVAVIKKELSLNMTQMAQALRVGRPALYGWLSDVVTPRSAHLSRLKELYNLAVHWGRLVERPVGKYLIMPLDDGKSLARLLTTKPLDSDRILRAFESIRSAIVVSEERKRSSGYRSAASIMRERGYDDDPRESQERRLADVR